MATVLEEFLVQLGFKIDLAQHRRFEENLKSSNTLVEKFSKGLTESLAKFANLATAATGSALTIVAAMGKISEAMAGTSYAADRIGVSVGNIRAMDTAFRSVGGAAGQAQNIMDRIGQNMARHPGFLLRFGIDPNTRPDEAMLKLGEYFRTQMEQGNTAVAVRQAEAAGLSYQEMRFLADQRLRPTYNQAQQQRAGMGINEQEIRDQSERFNRLLTQWQERFQAFDDWLYTKWGKQFNDAMENALAWFDKNLPKIEETTLQIKSNIDALIATFEKWWDALSPAGKQNVEAIAAIAVLTRIVKLPFAGPIAQIAALTTVITALISGYENWKNTGQSDGPIDWSKWGPAIDSATKALKYLNDDIIGPLADKLGVDRTFLPALEALAAYLAGPALLKAVLGGGLGSLLKLLLAIPGLGMKLPGAVLSALGITAVGATAGVVAGLEIGKNGIATDSQEEEAKHAPKLDKELMSESQASERVNADLGREQRLQGQGFLGRAMSGMMGALGLGGHIDPGQSHSADEIATYMVAHGWTPSQAQGIAANAIAESGGKPRIINDSGHAGLFQWDRSRQTTFARMFGHTMTDQSVPDEQLFREELDFADWELHNTESVAGKRISSTDTAASAAIAMGQGFERYASGPSAEDFHRAGIASQLAAQGAGTHGASPAANMPTPSAMTTEGAATAPSPKVGTMAAKDNVPQPASIDNTPIIPDTEAQANVNNLPTAPSSINNLPVAPQPPAPPASTINNNAGDTTHVNNTFSPNVTVNGVQDPQRTSELIDRNLNRQWTEYGVHSGAAYT